MSDNQSRAEIFANGNAGLANSVILARGIYNDAVLVIRELERDLAAQTERAVKAEAELKRWKDMPNPLDEAINSGNGTYKP